MEKVNVPEKKISVADALKYSAEYLKKISPQLQALSMLDVMQGGAWNLQHYITKGKGGISGISWKFPYVKLIYDAWHVGPEFLRGLSQSEKSNGAEKELLKTEADKIKITVAEAGKVFLKQAETYTELVTQEIFKSLTHGLAVHRKPNGERGIIIPEDSEAWQILQALPEAEREEKAQELAAGYELPSLEISGALDIRVNQFAPISGKQSFHASFKGMLSPLIIEEKKEGARAYFEITIGLDFPKGDPAAWSTEDQDAFWKKFHETFAKHAKKIIKETEVKRLKKRKRKGQRDYETLKITPEMPSRVGVHLAMQTIKKDEFSLELFSDDQKNIAKENNITNTGLDLSAPEYQAIIALGVIMEKEKVPELKNMASESMAHINFTVEQYMIAYSGKKNLTGNARKTAISALWNLYKKSFLLKYTRKNKSGEAEQVTSFTRLLFKVDFIKGSKNKGIEAVLDNILIDQYRTYSFLISPIIREKIRLGWKTPTPAMYNLLFLLFETAIHGRDTFRCRYEDLAKKLNLEKMFVQYHPGRFKKYIENMLNKMVEFGWVEHFAFLQSVDDGHKYLEVKILSRELLTKYKG